jgi:large subunit ribosomal protein L17
MHRHGYQGRKFHRERDQRRALIKSLADSLIKYEAIETTLPKAKEIIPYMEKLITKAKKGDLHSRRQVISGLMTLESAHKLVDEIAPKYTDRNSGHLTYKRTTYRRGDNALMARVSFIEVKEKAKPAAKPAVTTAKATTPKPKPAAAKKTPAKKPAVKAKAEIKK